MKRPITTLFLLSSVDGKISTGANDTMDVDRDYPTIDGVKEGLHQYYEIEQTTDLWSLNSGRVMAKVGANENPAPPKTPVSFVILDNKNLTEIGVKHFIARSDKFVLITTNKDHPAFGINADNMSIIYQEELSLSKILEKLAQDYGCERLTIQTGGTLNSLFLREGLIDYVDIVVAPILIGGKDTATLIDGRSLTSPEELGGVGVLKLESCEALENSYIRLRYSVVK